MVSHHRDQDASAIAFSRTDERALRLGGVAGLNADHALVTGRQQSILGINLITRALDLGVFRLFVGETRPHGAGIARKVRILQTFATKER